MSCPPSLDRAFGPGVDHCRRAFDFTQLFEECIFSIAPSALLLLAATVRTVVLQRARPRVTDTSMQVLKLVVIVCFGAVQSTILLLRCLDSTGRMPTTIAAAATAVIDVVAMICLSTCEHSRSIRPSSVLEVYLFFTLIFDGARTRTAWLIGQDDIYPILTTTGIAIKLALLLLEVRGKAGLSLEDANRSPEERSGAIGQLLLWWLVGLVRTGYRKILTLSDLFLLTDEMRSEAIGAKFDQAWMQYLIKPKSALLRSLWQTLRFRLLVPVLPRVVLIALTYCQPLLIRRVLLLQKEPVTDSSRNIGYGLIGAYGLVYTGIAVVSANYWFHMAKATTLVRGAIASKVYSRINDLSIMNPDDSAAMVLMSTDVERIVIGMNMMHETWANVVEVGIGIYLLQQQLGMPAFVALGLALACAASAVVLGSSAGRRQKYWMEAVERRISATASMLSSMKSVKMLGISSQLGAAIQKMRLDELESATKFRVLQIVMITLSYFPQTLSPIFTFAAYTLRPGEPSLEFSQMFTSLSILNILAGQFTQLFQSIPALFAALACLGRIQTFLLAPDRHIDNRMSGSLLPIISSSNFSLDSMISDLLTDSPELDAFQNRLKKFIAPLPPLNECWDAVHLKGASFAWSRRRGCGGQEKERKEVLRNITANLPANALTVIVGPVASGKSTLLKGILGEVYNTAGTVWVASRNAAFCDQTAWLRNTSVQQNILGYSLWDAEWYPAVVKACALKQDLERLPLGDQTVVGSEGIALSGGQIQRVAIARAVYAKRDMVVFDDVLSGLDSTTMNNLMHALFGKEGLLRQSKTTVLLATHSVHVLKYADHIVALGSNGSVSEQGSFPELRSRHGGYVERLCRTVEYTDSDYEDDDDGFAAPPAPRAATQQGIAVTLPITATARLEVPAADAPNRQMGDRKAYRHYFLATGVRNTVIFIIAELLLVSFEVVPQVWLSRWADATSTHSYRGAGFYLAIYAALQVGFLVSLFIGARHVASTMVVRSGRWLHAQLVRTVSAAPLSFFASTDAGITLNRFSQDVHLLDTELPVSLLLLGAAALGTLAQAVVVLVAANYVGAAMGLVFAVFYVVQRCYLRTSRQLRYLDLEAKSPLYSLFLEALRGRATVRAFRWQDECQAEFLCALDDSQRPVYLLTSVQQWLALVLGLITAAVAVVLVAIMVTLKEKGTTTAGLGGVALLNMMSLSTNLMHAVVTWTRLETSIGAVARIKDFAEQTPTEVMPREAVGLPKDWPTAGAVEFNDVAVSYKVNTELALKDITFSVKPGEKVAICGHSGSGKSTLISSLFRLVDPSTGNIAIDGIDISALPHDALRACLVALPQEPYFASWASIRFNADPVDRATDAAITQALERVGLADTLLGATRRPGPGMGLDAQMDLEMLSHGQRQLFCLARAMLKKRVKGGGGGVLVVDEATSSVDGETDKRMQRILRDEFGGPDWTWLVVAHRVATILDFNKVAVFERGRLIEFDKPTVLLERPGGSAFRQLYMEFGSG